MSYAGAAVVEKLQAEWRWFSRGNCTLFHIRSSDEKRGCPQRRGGLSKEWQFCNRWCFLFGTTALLLIFSVRDPNPTRNVCLTVSRRVSLRLTSPIRSMARWWLAKPISTAGKSQNFCCQVEWMFKRGVLESYNQVASWVASARLASVR